MSADRAPRTTPLNRHLVLRAAVDLADQEGIEAVSMRRLAQRLQVVPMALYKHVADKEDLLDGMVDEVIAEFHPAAGALGQHAWPEQVRAIIMGARDALAHHPWARRAIETRTRRTAAVLGHMETLTQVFLGGGLSPDLTHHVMHLLGNRIWGWSPELFNDPSGQPSPPSPRAQPLDPADYPGIMAITADALARRAGEQGCDEDFEFRFALDVLLTTIATLHERQWASPGRAASSTEGRG